MGRSAQEVAPVREQGPHGRRPRRRRRCERLPEFYSIYRETAKRAGFVIRTYESYLGVWEAFAKLGMARLLMAEDARRDAGLATLFVLRVGDRVVEPYGGMTAGRRREPGQLPAQVGGDPDLARAGRGQLRHVGHLARRDRALQGRFRRARDQVRRRLGSGPRSGRPAGLRHGPGLARTGSGRWRHGIRKVRGGRTRRAGEDRPSDVGRAGRPGDRSRRGWRDASRGRAGERRAARRAGRRLAAGGQLSAGRLRAPPSTGAARLRGVAPVTASPTTRGGSGRVASSSPSPASTPTATTSSPRPPAPAPPPRSWSGPSPDVAVAQIVVRTPPRPRRRRGLVVRRPEPASSASSASPARTARRPPRSWPRPCSRRRASRPGCITTAALKVGRGARRQPGARHHAAGPGAAGDAAGHGRGRRTPPRSSRRTSHGLALDRVGGDRLRHRHLHEPDPRAPRAARHVRGVPRRQAEPLPPASARQRPAKPLHRPWPRAAIVNADDPAAPLFAGRGPARPAPRRHVRPRRRAPTSAPTAIERGRRRPALRRRHSPLARPRQPPARRPLQRPQRAGGRRPSARRWSCDPTRSWPASRASPASPAGWSGSTAASRSASSWTTRIRRPRSRRCSTSSRRWPARAAAVSIAVFGSAGERDVAKRPMMGRVAGERCRLVVVTDEDPRGEDRRGDPRRDRGRRRGRRASGAAATCCCIADRRGGHRRGVRAGAARAMSSCSPARVTSSR